MPKKMTMFRASILYTGKYAGQSGCAFVNAISKEAAVKYMNDIMVENLKATNIPTDCFKLEVAPSSQEEVDLYVKNKATRSYNGILN